MTLTRSSPVHVIAGFLTMGAWAAFANRNHPMPAPLLAFLVQGKLSARITFGLDLSRLASLAEVPGNVDRHDPNSPIRGVIGADPRTADLAESGGLLARMTDWLARQAV